MISIVTPVFNGQKFIEACIKVVADQNCSNIEHIVIDGGSTDGTVEIIRQCEKKNPQLRWISEPDDGQSDAMNKGINMANGEIIGVLNVDDFYEPNVLNRVTEIFKTLPEPSFLVANCNILDSADRINKVNKPSKLNLVDLIMLREPFPMNPSAYFYHKSLHNKVGLYTVDEHYMMDLEFVLKAVQSANVKYIDEIWGNHRQIPETKTFTLKSNRSHSKYLLDFIDKQRRNLPLIYKLQLFPIMLKQKINFFVKHPQNIVPAIRHKISKI